MSHFAPPLRTSGVHIGSADQIGDATVERQNHTRGAVRTEHLGLSAGLEQSFTAFTTTTVGTYQLVSTLPITIWATHSQLNVMLHTQVNHSNAAAGDSFTLDMDLSNSSYGGSVALTFSRLETIRQAWSYDWRPLGGTHTMDLSKNSIVPGTYDVQMWVKNLTAGTLSVGGTAQSSRYLSAFAYGRETR